MSNILVFFLTISLIFFLALFGEGLGQIIGLPYIYLGAIFILDSMLFGIICLQLAYAAYKLCLDLFTTDPVYSINETIGTMQNNYQPLSRTEYKQFNQLNNNEKDKRLLESYKNLLDRFELLDQAIANKTSLQNGDELIPYFDIDLSDGQEPVLLLKVFKKEESWRVVPQSTRITNFNSLNQILKISPCLHPLTRESIVEPNKYKKYETLFIYMNYRGYCPEKIQCENKIKKRLAEINKPQTPKM